MIFLAIYAVVSLAAFVLLMIAIHGGQNPTDHRTHNLPDLLGEHGSQDGARGIHNKRGDTRRGGQDHAV
jgi:hypothetical protein